MFFVSVCAVTTPQTETKKKETTVPAAGEKGSVSESLTTQHSSEIPE